MSAREKGVFAVVYVRAGSLQAGGGGVQRAPPQHKEEECLAERERSPPCHAGKVEAWKHLPSGVPIWGASIFPKMCQVPGRHGSREAELDSVASPPLHMGDSIHPPGLIIHQLEWAKFPIKCAGGPVRWMFSLRQENSPPPHFSGARLPTSLVTTSLWRKEWAAGRGGARPHRCNGTVTTKTTASEFA